MGNTCGMKFLALAGLCCSLIVSCEGRKDRQDEGVHDPSSGKGLRGSGPAIARNDLFTYDTAGNTIIQEHDLLSDSQHYAVAVAARYDSDGSWAAAGGQSILKDGGVYYMALRQRSGVGRERGVEWEMWSSSDLSLWVREWSLARDSVDSPPVGKILSIEGVSLKRFARTYYLYVSAVSSFTQKWAMYYVRAESIPALRDSLKNGLRWHPISVRGYKDPSVCEFDGSYYAICGHDTLGMYRPILIRSSEPSFSSFEVMALPAKPYRDLFTSRISSLPGTIFYDPTSHSFIYWGTAYYRSQDEICWFWTVSHDLRNWKYVERSVVMTGYRGKQHTARYFSYHALDDDRIIVTMEWDHDGDSRGDVFVWNYADDPQGDSSASYVREMGE